MPARFRRTVPLALPELAEQQVVRHFTHLAQLNYSVDSGFYPLGSCTMKYNPKVNDRAAALPGFADLHPLQPEQDTQGALRLMWELERLLAGITGLAEVSLQPAAGAHAELTALLMFKAYHQARGERRGAASSCRIRARTNPRPPRSAYAVTTVRSDERGNVGSRPSGGARRRRGRHDADEPEHAGTSRRPRPPSPRCTGRRAQRDGALRTHLGVARPGDLGFDVLHLNLHKTLDAARRGRPAPGRFAPPRLAPYLPVPRRPRASASVSC